MRDIRWWIAVGQVVLTAGVVLGSMFTRFRPRAGSLVLRALLVVSIGGALSLILGGLRRADSIPTWSLGVGTLLNVVAHVAFWAAIRAHGDNRPSGAFAAAPPESLVLSGPYEFVRHPFYVSYVAALAAGAAFCGPLVMWLVPVWMAGLYGLAAVQEERLILRSSLGPAYAQYRRRVGMFVPRVSRRSGQTPDRVAHAHPVDMAVAPQVRRRVEREVVDGE